MKIYDYNGGFTIKKLQKKEKEVLHSDSNFQISNVNTKLAGSLILVELPLVKKVFYCDRYAIRGNVIIATALEDDDVSVVNAKTGDVTRVQRVEYATVKGEDMAIVTLMNGKRKFLDKDGNIEEAEIGSGGFRRNDNETRFVDENDNVASLSSETQFFTTIDSKVRAGSVYEEGIYRAVSYNEQESVIYYNCLGEEIDAKEMKKYKALYKLFTSEIKLEDINEEWLIDSKFYNAIVEVIRIKMQNLASDCYEDDYYRATQVVCKLDKILERLQVKREAVVSEHVEQEVKNLNI